MNASEQIGDLAAALAKAQAEIKDAARDRENPFFHSSYATLSSVWDACRGALSKHGLAVAQITGLVDGALVLRTRLMHGSGQWIEGVYPVRPAKDDPQGIGSAITYARRYALAAIVGVCPDDDDGEGAHGRSHASAASPRAEKSAPEQPRAEAPRAAPKGDEPVLLPNYGKSKGQPIAGQSIKTLEFYADGCRRSLGDAAKARWHDKERALLAALEAEMARQAGGNTGGRGGDPFWDQAPPPSDEDAPF